MSNIPHNPFENPERPELVIDLKDGSNEQVSIIVVHHNRPEFLSICLQSIFITSNFNNFEIIVVDNNSEQESQEYLDAIEAEGVKVVRLKSNQYWSAAANKGASVADPNSKYLIFMHCDTVVLNQSWIDLLANISQSKNSGFVGTSLQTYYIAKQKINFVQECCVLVTRECWKDCGPWPEELPLIGNSFIFTLKAQVKGYKPTSISNQVVYHYRAAAFNVNEYEKMSEVAMTIVPKLMQAIQNG